MRYSCLNYLHKRKAEAQNLAGSGKIRRVATCGWVRRTQASSGELVAVHSQSAIAYTHERPPPDHEGRTGGGVELGRAGIPGRLCGRVEGVPATDRLSVGCRG